MRCRFFALVFATAATWFAPMPLAAQGTTASERPRERPRAGAAAETKLERGR